jgi:hypothetical protein
MRNKLFALIASFALGPFAFAQQEPWANKMFQTTSHNFGTQPFGAQMKHTLTMTNIWKAPLEITDIRTSCGCVKATPSKVRLGPGETATLDILMDGTKFNGVKTVNVYVKVGPQYISTAVLSISANTAQVIGVAFNPPNGIEFGSVSKGQPAVQSIEVRNAANAAWQVTEIIKTQNAPFELEVANLDGPGRGYLITAKLKSDVVKGEFREYVTLKTNDPTNRELKFPVTGSVRGTLNYNGNVTLTNLRVGGESSGTIVLSANRPFRVVGVNGVTPDIEMTAPSESKQVHVLSVKVRPPSLGEYRRTLTFQTDLNNEIAVVNLEGVAQ